MGRDQVVGIAVIAALVLVAALVVHLDGSVCARRDSFLCGAVRGFTRVVAPRVGP